MVCGRSAALRKCPPTVENCSRPNTTIGMIASSAYGNGRHRRVWRKSSRSGSPKTMKKRPMLFPSGLPGSRNEPTHSVAYTRKSTTKGRRGWTAFTPASASPTSARMRKARSCDVSLMYEPGSEKAHATTNRTTTAGARAAAKIDVAPSGLRPRDDVGHHEGRGDDEPHGVGEDADRDRQGGPHRVTPGEQREAGHRERERHQEGMLPVRLVERHHEREPPGGPDVVDLPQVAQVEIEGDGDGARGDDDDELAGHVLRQHVVDEAVGDGAVTAAVPVRVPEDGIAATQQEHLVGVGGVVPAGHTAPLHQQRDQRHGGGRRQPQGQQAATRPQPALERGEGHPG